MNPPAKPSGEDPAARIAEPGQDRSAGVLTRSNALQPSGPAFAKDLPKHTHYKAGREIAHGGMGAVLEAKDQSLDRVVAMKVILPGSAISDDTRQRFLQEAKVLGKLEHPNIVPIHELGIDEQGRVFYTMKLVRGVTLQQVLDEIRAEDSEAVARYPLNHLLTIFQKVCDAVAFAHSKGVLHRDLKPSNIMIGEFGEVQVMDWGLAKVTEVGDGGLQIENCKLEISNSQARSKPEPLGGGQSAPKSHAGSASASALHTLDGQIMGSPNFMAPEQAAGRSSAIDERTDIYGLGGILYSILTLRPPIASGSSLREMLDQVRRGEIRIPTEYNTVPTAAALGKAPAQAGIPHCPGRKVPAPLSAITLKALATRPAERYQNVSALQADISAYQNGFVTSAEQPNPFLLAKLWIRRHRVAFGVISAFTLLATIASVLVVSMWLEFRGTASTFYDKSEALVAAGRFKEALSPIEYAIRLEPKNAAYHNLHGNIQQSLLDIPKAHSAYAAALKLDSGHSHAAENLQLCERILAKEGARAELPSEALSELHAAMVSQARLAEAQVIIQKLLARDAKIRNEFLTNWQARLQQAGLKGDLSVSESGEVELKLEGQSVTNLAALKGLPLSVLHLSHTRVSDLTPLKGMPLRVLQIDVAEVADISALAGMNLVDLKLGATRVADLSPLTGMPLVNLDVEGSPVADLRPLQGLTSLKSLLLRNTKVIDFNPLSSLKLYFLRLSGPSFWDARLLKDMPLNDVGLWNTSITNLAPLSGTPLERLDVSDTRIRDLSPLRGLALKSLQLHSSDVEDLRPLAGMPIASLNLARTPVQDLTPLRGMKFEVLQLNATRIPDLSPLRDAEITHLELSGARITDLRPLEGKRLRVLYLHGCSGIRDLSPLVKCEQLEVLTIPTTATNILVLRALPKLKQLGYSVPWPEPISDVADFWKTYDMQHP